MSRTCDLLVFLLAVDFLMIEQLSPKEILGLVTRVVQLLWVFRLLFRDSDCVAYFVDSFVRCTQRLVGVFAQGLRNECELHLPGFLCHCFALGAVDMPTGGPPLQFFNPCIWSVNRQRPKRNQPSRQTYRPMRSVNQSDNQPIHHHTFNRVHIIKHA